MDEANNEDNEKTIKIIEFRGKSNEFKMWHKKFLARASLKGYKLALLGKINIPKHDEELSGNSDSVKKKIKARKANNMAYSDLRLCMIDEVSFGIVAESVTEELPDGSAAVAWKNLVDKYQPKTGANLVQLKLEFATCRMKNEDEDPDVWITELENLRQRLKDMKSQISDQDLMLHILAYLPEKYTVVGQLARNTLNHTNDSLTIIELKEMLNSRFQWKK